MKQAHALYIDSFQMKIETYPIDFSVCVMFFAIEMLKAINKD